MGSHCGDPVAFIAKELADGMTWGDQRSSLMPFLVGGLTLCHLLMWGVGGGGCATELEPL